jgi:exonuclease VII small subunit
MSNPKHNPDEQPIGELLAELEATVRWFESQESADVEAGLAKVRRGAELVKQLRERLKKTENEFAEVTASLEDAE